MVLDLSSDRGLTHFHALSRILDLPEFVKQADFQEQIETNNLPKDAFADTWTRTFPIHTKTAAYLSYAYYLRQVDKMSLQDAGRCKAGFVKAARYWNLYGEYAQIYTAVNNKREKQASAPSPTSIIEGAKQLVMTRHKYAYTQRSKMAKDIMKAAAAAKLSLTALPEEIHTMAGLGITTKNAAMLELAVRWQNEKRASLAQPLAVCIEALTRIKSDLLGGEVCEKIAGIIDQYDRTVSKVSFPEDVLFGFTKHAANRLTNRMVSMVDGTTYWGADLRKAAEAFQVLGNDIAKDVIDTDGSVDVIKASEILEVLPRNDADMLKEALATAGVNPCNTDKTAMVSMVITPLQRDLRLTTVPAPREKRSTLLQNLEAQDPMVKRALTTIRRLKAAEDKKDEKPEDKKESPTPRGVGGVFIGKAPNDCTSKPCK